MLIFIDMAIIGGVSAVLQPYTKANHAGCGKEEYNSNLKNIFDDICPLTQITINDKKKQAPWFTQALKELHSSVIRAHKMHKNNQKMKSVKLLTTKKEKHTPRLSRLRELAPRTE